MSTNPYDHLHSDEYQVQERRDLTIPLEGSEQPAVVALLRGSDSQSAGKYRGRVFAWQLLSAPYESTGAYSGSGYLLGDPEDMWPYLELEVRERAANAWTSWQWRNGGRQAAAAEAAVKEAQRVAAALAYARKHPEATYDAVICPHCDALQEEEPEENPHYECGSCGNEFSREDADDSNRCPDCNRFGAKTDDYTCPDCGEGVDSWSPVRVVMHEGEITPLGDAAGVS